jgi:hypothetical protein
MEYFKKVIKMKNFKNKKNKIVPLLNENGKQIGTSELNFKENTITSKIDNPCIDCGFKEDCKPINKEIKDGKKN